MDAERLSPSEVAPRGLQDTAQSRSISGAAACRENVRIADQWLRLLPRCAQQRRRKAGETKERLYLLNAWREALHFSPAGRAALAWTEALTDISTTRASDTDYKALRAHFSDKQIVDLTYLIGMINFWNHLAIAMRYVPDADS